MMIILLVSENVYASLLQTLTTFVTEFLIAWKFMDRMAGVVGSCHTTILHTNEPLFTQTHGANVETC